MILNQHNQVRLGNQMGSQILKHHKLSKLSHRVLRQLIVFNSVDEQLFLSIHLLGLLCTPGPLLWLGCLGATWITLHALASRSLG